MDPFDITHFNCVKDSIEEHTWHASWALLNTFQGRLDLTYSSNDQQGITWNQFFTILSLLQLFPISNDNSGLYTNKLKPANFWSMWPWPLTLTLTFPFSSSTMFSNFRSRWTTPFCKKKHNKIYYLSTSIQLNYVNKNFYILCMYIIQFFLFYYFLFKFSVILFLIHYHNYFSL